MLNNANGNRNSLSPKRTRHPPEKIAMLLIYLATKGDERLANIIHGDIKESCEKRLDTFDKEDLHSFLWYEVFRTVWPLFVQNYLYSFLEKIRKLLSHLGILSRLLERLKKYN